MNIRELSIEEFSRFALESSISNHYQSINYALLKAEEGYDYEFIGYCEQNTILAAALIIYKKIGTFYYGYSPRGFLIDYSNYYFLDNFTKQLKEYYGKRNFAFIKINPEIAIGTLNKKTLNFEYNENYSIIDKLNKCGYIKLKSNLNFESLLPRFNAILPLSNLNVYDFKKNTRNKIRKAIHKGLKIELADKFGIDIFYNLIKDKIKRNEFYYKDMFNIYNKDDSIDLFLVSIDYKQYLLNAQEKYNEELEKNITLNEKIANHFSTSLINRKMNSDKAVLAYKNDISEATRYINSGETKYIAGALVIKHKNRISIEITGFDKEYKRYAANYFLHFAIMNYYKNDYKYVNLNGISGDMSKDNPYHGLNRFKLGFKPNVYEYIGEFDLPINEKAYLLLKNSNLLAKEFNKKDLL